MNELMLHAAFAVGGGLGAVARQALTLAITHRLPISTLVVNVLGCFLLGVGLVALANLPDLDGEEERRLAVGFCGGFTTFSSLAYQTLDLQRRETVVHALGNVLLSPVAGLAAFALGAAIAGRL